MPQVTHNHNFIYKCLLNYNRVCLIFFFLPWDMLYDMFYLLISPPVVPNCFSTVSQFSIYISILIATHNQALILSPQD